MGEVTHQQVDLMLKLYDLRREPKLREAREWFVANFQASGMEEMMQKYPPGGQGNTFIRMTVSYWDMVAGIVNRGLIDEDPFIENTVEQWVVWEQVKGIVPALRAAFKNPLLYANLEKNAERLEAWREKRAPGSLEALRQRFLQLRQQAGKSARP